MSQSNSTTVFADATVDTAFKRIFGTEQFELCEMSDNKEIWLSLLGNSMDLDEIPDSLKDDRMFRTFFEGSRMANFTKEQVTQYTKDMMYDWDIENAKDFAKKIGYEDGFAEGKAAGEALGRAEGIAEGLAKVARTMKVADVPVEDIARFTGLTPAASPLLTAPTTATAPESPSLRTSLPPTPCQ